ncbi:hypothetical protein [Micromonospora sp. WMMD812]|uniref:hypothetical protein n=1 Tax=Micromonospora sp. WMMD812 TaxID=3015152 RepID=UPI00248AC516|nr:hypothetical protein [Micromonospora sp. WMMD812]WBB67079.1 hypothetical protein O7603_28850 [Micromonospora sp. WMMD812]
MLTVSVLIGLTLQAAAVVGVHVAIRGDWMRRPGALLLLAAVGFHGGTEVMQWLWPERNIFRVFLDQDDIDDWMLLVSTAICAYAISYAMIVVRRIRKPAHAASEDGLARLRLPWLLVLVVPLVAATFAGRGALQAVAPAQAETGEVVPERDGALVALASEFLVPLVAVLGAVVLVRWGMRWLVPVLAAQGAVLAVAGTRAMIVFAALLTLVGAALHGVRPSRRQIALILVVVSGFTALISSTRAVAGREVFEAGQGSGERIDALLDGAAQIHTERSREAILNDLVYRFDGNTFGAMIFDSLRGSGEPVGMETVGNNIAMLMPSVLNPDKVASRSLEQRNEEAYIDAAFGLSQHVDWLPTILGTAVAYYGPVGLILFALLFGAAMAAAEVLALASLTTARVMFAIGLAHCALLYGSGPQVFVTTLRTVVALVLVLSAVAWLRRRRQATVPAAVSLPAVHPMAQPRHSVVPGHQMQVRPLERELVPQGWKNWRAKTTPAEGL